MAELNAYGFTDTDSTVKVSAIQASLRNILYRKPWPFLEKVMTLTFDGTNATPLNSPPDLRAVMKIIDYTTGNPRRVRFTRTDDAEERFALTDKGAPFYYYFEGSALKLYGIPPSTQSLRLRYLRSAPVITSTSTEAALLLPPDYHEALVFRSVVRLADMDDDNDVAARFDGLYENVMGQMTEAIMSLQHDEPEFVHVIDPDDWDDNNGTYGY
jgi:hypothetical protein